MTTDSWINLIAAILIGGGTLFLGIMAWRTIRQTRNIQKAEKREIILNDIQKWAESGIVAIAPASLQIDRNMILDELDLNLRPVAAKMISVIIYAEKIGGDLCTKVLIASKRLNAIGRAIQDPKKHINIVHARKVLIVAFTDVIKAIADFKIQEVKS